MSMDFNQTWLCALILWRSGLGLHMGKFLQFLMELIAQTSQHFTFPDDK